MTSNPSNQGLGNATVEIDGFANHNTSVHHTSDYENKSLVLRRGEKFKVGLTFKGIEFKEILRTVLRFTLDLKIATVNQFSNSCKIVKTIEDSKWGMEIVEKNQQQFKLVVEVNIPVDVIVGRYVMDVIAPSSSKSLGKFGIIILFNPWNKGDEVYLDDEQLRQEYVLNDNGIIYQGYAERGPEGIEPKYWNFGQFEENVLDCVLLLLEKDYRGKKFILKTLSKRNNAVWVSRRLSGVINAQDEKGLLVGNWTADYSRGVQPLAWDGSVEIFQKYFNSGSPVKYGQCWVFSGAMTTALRGLGIPSRSVTNFLSAHDTDGTMTIDVFFTEDGDMLDYFSADSVWNFHVWNEIWTKRKDLPGDTYDGWQAVDSTPQELSNDIFQMGPAPVKAVKEGEIYAGFDTGFVFGEVNADYVKWIVKPDEDKESSKFSRNLPSHVGRYISTKKVGKDERDDITDLYKYPEKSQEERKAFATAYSFGKGPETWEGQLDIGEEGDDLTIDLSTTPTGIIPNGDGFSCIIDVKNTSKVNLTVNLTSVVNSMQYTGDTKMLIRRDKVPGIVIEAGKSVKQDMKIKPEEYLEKLTDINCLKFVVVAKVQETGKQYVEDLSFKLSNKACIDVKFSSTPLKVGEVSKVTVTFTNPLPIRLTNITFSVEGAGLTKSLKVPVSGHVYSGKKVSASFDVTPKKPGVRRLLVDIDTKQVKDFKSFATVQVNKPLGA